ncbi:MAG: hypothetical protein IPM29_32650 [Planctomycetes bacterium]|nr:hypothetical protein [Planctomycetota bacterium]
MLKTNKNVLTQIEGQHRVAAELSARSYLPSILPERCYQCDALILSPAGASFGIEVKTNRERNSWWCHRPTEDSRALLWVFVELRPIVRFFILTKGEVEAEYDAYQASAARKANDHGFTAKQLGAWVTG